MTPARFVTLVVLVAIAAAGATVAVMLATGTPLLAVLPVTLALAALLLVRRWK